MEEDHPSEVNGVPCCPECGRPVDDIDKMTEQELIDSIRIGLLKDLARNLAMGTATHQEKAIAKGLLRDNGSKVVPEEYTAEEVEEEPQVSRKRPVRKFGESRG